MGRDRFVYWNRSAPTLANVLSVFEDYLSNAALKVEVVDDCRIVAILVGKPSYPFRREPNNEKYRAGQESHDERWIEVFCAKTNIDVITRMTDTFTNIVADGFAALAAQYWNGAQEFDVPDSVVKGRAVKKPDRRSGDRRAAKRRTGDKLKARLR